jgi:cob(I)alamin adenosyltransferase
VRWLEEVLDAQNSKLEPLSSFVLPGGTQGAALLHVARTVVRRAEREIVEIGFQEPVTPAVIRYMNRLSDLLFVLARVENDQGRADALWEPGATANTGRASAVD